MININNVMPLSRLFEALREVPDLADLEFSCEDVPWSFEDPLHAFVRVGDFIDWAVGFPPDKDDPLAAALLAALGDAKFIDLEN